MKITNGAVLVLTVATAAMADVSYTATTKLALQTPRPPGVEKRYVKGSRIVSESGATSTIAGYASTETVLTMDIDNARIRQAPMKTQAEVRLSMASSMPVAAEIEAFKKKSAGLFTWIDLSNFERPQETGPMHDVMQRALADIERKSLELPGARLLEIFKIRAAAGGAPGANLTDRIGLKGARGWGRV